MEQIENLVKQALQQIQECTQMKELNDLRVYYLGKRVRYRN